MTEGQLGDVKVESVIVCDDIRKEDNGKFILIGVYNDVLVSHIPIELVLSFFIQIRSSGVGLFEVGIRLTGPHQVEYLSGRFRIDILRPGLANVVLPSLRANVEADGELRLELQQGDLPWVAIKTFEVRKREST